MVSLAEENCKRLKMDNPILKAQKKAIGSLKEAIRSFCASKKMKTRVIPLAIPTGWGKTKIAVQGVFKANYRWRYKTYKPTFILWPQKESHIEGVWCGETEWSRINGGVRVPTKLVECDDFKSDDYYSINDALRFLNLRKKAKKTAQKAKFFSKKLSSLIEQTTGPIVFIIDEWHSKKIIETYEDRKCNETPEEFWRHYLLQENTKKQGRKRKLFVLLLSATPIATTAAMDSAPSEIEKKDGAQEEIAKSVKSFNELTRVGNQNRQYNLYQIYPDLIEEQTKILGKYKGVKLPKKFGKNAWVNQYVSSDTSKISIKRQYEDEQYEFVKNEKDLKFRTFERLLNRNPNRKFVVFCHYKKVALQLQERLGKKAVFLRNSGNTRSREIKRFNELPINQSFQVMILMDCDSQGISLHQSNAWLVHYELSWNPIRIIQRFGRVWRLKLKDEKDEESLVLTCPKSFYVPFTYSGEEEQLNRLYRRWEFLSKISEDEDGEYKSSSHKPLMNLTPIPYKIALGRRLTPKP